MSSQQSEELVPNFVTTKLQSFKETYAREAEYPLEKTMYGWVAAILIAALPPAMGVILKAQLRMSGTDPVEPKAHSRNDSAESAATDFSNASSAPSQSSYGPTKGEKTSRTPDFGVCRVGADSKSDQLLAVVEVKRSRHEMRAHIRQMELYLGLLLERPGMWHKSFWAILIVGKGVICWKLVSPHLFKSLSKRDFSWEKREFDLIEGGPNHFASWLREQSYEIPQKSGEELAIPPTIIDRKCLPPWLVQRIEELKELDWAQKEFRFYYVLQSVLAHCHQDLEFSPQSILRKDNPRAKSPDFILYDRRSLVLLVVEMKLPLPAPDKEEARQKKIAKDENQVKVYLKEVPEDDDSPGVHQNYFGLLTFGVTDMLLSTYINGHEEEVKRSYDTERIRRVLTGGLAEVDAFLEILEGYINDRHAPYDDEEDDEDEGDDDKEGDDDEEEEEDD